MKPIIGITLSVTGHKQLSLNNTYVTSVVNAGGIPIILPPNPQAIEEYLQIISGLLLSGGTDIDPLHYKQDRNPLTEPPNPMRDNFEIPLCRAALEKNIPILGICRGMQVLNVALGGTLVQHIDGHRCKEDKDNPDLHWQTYLHDVDVVPGKKLHSIIGDTKLSVNSIHHQAVDQLGEGVIVSAKGDQIPESIEVANKYFAIGVQWHPEALAKLDTRHAAIFKAFVEECI